MPELVPGGMVTRTRPWGVSTSTRPPRIASTTPTSKRSTSISHSCWLPENSADLMDYYFGRAVAKDQGLVGTEFCCCDEALEGGYDEWDYDGGLVSDDPNYQVLGQNEAVSPTEAACGS